MLRNGNSFVSASRCASCIGESARAAWYRHSDGWRGAPLPGPRRSPWDSLPSLRHEGSLNDSGYRSNRADSFEQRQAKLSSILLSKLLIISTALSYIFIRNENPKGIKI